MKYLIIIIILLLISCSITKTTSFSNCENKTFGIKTISIDSISKIRTISFHDLEKHTGKVVRLKAHFTRFGETYDTISVDNNKRAIPTIGLRIALGMSDINDSNLHNFQWNNPYWKNIYQTNLDEYTLIDIVGILHDDLITDHIGKQKRYFQFIAVKSCGKYKFIK